MARLTAGPPDAKINGDGFRTYRWPVTNPDGSITEHELLSVTSIRKLVGEPWPLVAWQIGKVVDRALTEDFRSKINAYGMDAPQAEAALKKWLRAAATEDRDVAANKGVDIHSALELGLQPDDCNEVTRPYIRQVHNFLADTGYRIVAQEKQVFNLCQVEGTRVLTRDLRWVPVETLVSGDGLWAFSEESGPGGRSWEPATVVSNGISLNESETVRIVLESGTELISTIDHPYLARGGEANARQKPMAGDPTHWIKAGDLRVGNVLPRYLVPWEDDRSYEAGWLAGMFDGEGHMIVNALAGGYHLGVSQNEGPLLDALRSAFRARGVRWAESKTGPTHGTTVTLHVRGGYAQIARLLGSIRPIRMLDKHMMPKTLRAKVHDRIVAVEPAGRRRVVNLETSTHTYISEGYGSHNSVGYAGTLDVLFQRPDGTYCIGDWKTGKNLYADNALQLTAYLNGEFIGLHGVVDEEMTAILAQTTDAGILHLSPDGWSWYDLHKTDEEIVRAYFGFAWAARFLSAYPKADSLFTKTRRGKA